MHKHWDICFGVVGTGTTFSLAAINAALACAAGVITITVLLFRLRREWRNRNQPPDKNDE